MTERNRLVTGDFLTADLSLTTTFRHQFLAPVHLRFLSTLLFSCPLIIVIIIIIIGSSQTCSPRSRLRTATLVEVDQCGTLHGSKLYGTVYSLNALQRRVLLLLMLLKLTTTMTKTMMIMMMMMMMIKSESVVV